jgi:plastocyanin
MRLNQHRAAALVLAVAAAFVAATPAFADAPAAAAPAAAGEVTIRLEHFMFAPGTITVPAGATVRWQNLDGEPHTVVSVEGLFRSGALDQGDTYAYTFKVAGRYRYVCSIHPQMLGTIVVTAAP